MQIGGLQKFNLGGYPGKSAMAVCLLGCNFKCPWCDALDFILPERINSLPKVSNKEFLNALKEAKGIVEAVIITGGEPTINQDLPKFCSLIKKAGFKVKIDTNGSNFKMLKDLVDKKLVDYVALDIKAPRVKYGQVSGLENMAINYILENIDQTIKLIKESGVDYEFSTVVTPLLQRSDILEIVNWIKPAKRYFLRPFRPEKTLDPNFSFLNPLQQEELTKIQQTIAPWVDG